MSCAEGLHFISQYYPACPQPNLTLSLSKQTESAFLTVAEQDQLGCLGVHHEKQWIDGTHIPGAQTLITNGKFDSGNKSKNISKGVLVEFMSHLNNFCRKINPPISTNDYKDYVSFTHSNGTPRKASFRSP
ncbi:hypothetical protein OIU78_004337 [Salix suchowensis]|nr:hypothetical protein OIU78_004337 [Salix suchowensis]